MANSKGKATEQLFFDPPLCHDEDAAKLAQELLKEEGADPNTLVEHKEHGWELWFNSQKCTSMHKYASCNKPLTLEVLHDCGGKVDLLDDAGNQPMHYACNTSIAKKLQQWGADVNALNPKKEIPALTSLAPRIVFAPDEKRMEWIVKELAEWTKMGAVLEIPNKFGKSVFDIFPKKFSSYAKRARAFYENYQKDHATISETFDLADDQHIKKRLSIGSADGKEEETFTSASIPTKHFQKHLGQDR